MPNCFRPFFLGVLFLPLIAQASIKPFVTISMGADAATVGITSTNIAFISPFYNTYAGNNTNNTELFGGAFLGAEFNSHSKWVSQLGIGYYQNGAFQTRGNVDQFGNPSFNDVGYNYDVISHRLLVETKLLYAIKKIFHPYIDIGIGEAFNNASDYTEYALNTSGIPTAAPFGNHSTNSFTYLAGVGVDVDMNKYVRIGFGYRYAGLGNASLSTSTQQIDSTTLKNNHITSNEYLFQITGII